MIGRWFRKAPGPTVRKLTGVRASLNASHRNRTTGVVHGHRWNVTLWFLSYSSPADAVHLRNALTEYLARYEGKCLPDKLAWAEDLACAIMHGMTPDPHGYDGRLGEVVAVEISREREGLLARAERRSPCS